MTKIQSTLCFLAMASMFGWGCSNNRAATPDANSSQPSSSASSSNSNTTANADQKFVEDAAKGNRAEVAAFLNKVASGGEALIPFGEIDEVARASFLTLRAAQEHVVISLDETAS